MSLRYPLACPVLALLLIQASANAQPFFDSPWRSFQTASHDAQGNFAVDVTAADLNGDGLADAVVGQNIFAPGVRVMLNLGTEAGRPATLENTGILYPLSHGAWDVVAADLDGDGDRDLAVANSDGNYQGATVGVLLNNGNGTFLPAQYFPAGGPSSALVAADLDDDGDIDLAVANYGFFGSGSTVSVLRNTGAASFAAPVSFPAGDAPARLDAGDLDGDGDVDLAVANQAAQARITLLFNNGSGNYSAPQAFTPFPGAAPPALVILDPDGDGDLDVLHAGDAHNVGSSSEGNLVLLRNGGAGSFAVERSLYGLPNQELAHHLVAADLDGDGRDDAVGAQPFEAGFVVFRDNNGSGFLTGEMYAAVSRSGESHGTIASAVGDLDGDGDPDVLTTGRIRRLVSAHENLGDGTFPERPIYGRGSLHTVLDLGDADGDGDLDAVTSHGGASMSDVRVQLNAGGLFSESAVLSGPFGYGKFRDLNGDGVLDVLMVTAPSPPGGTPITFWTALGNGNGTYQGIVQHNISACGLGHPNAVDLDEDGDLDVINTEVAACINIPESGRRLFISVNNGNATFQPPIIIMAGAAPYNTVAGDFNEDGHLDLATASMSISALLFGNGDATFQQPESPLATGRLGANIITLDLNADANLDLVSLDDFSPDGSAADESLLSVMLGTGTGAFSETEHPEHPTQDFRDWVAAGDLDDDGDTDLVAGGVNDALVFLNNGAGSYAFSSRYGIGTDAFAPHLADVTGDGLLDLVALVSHEVPPSGGDFGIVVVPGVPLTTGAEPDAPAEADGPVELSAPAPNPATDRVGVTLTLNQAQSMTVTILDALGRRVATVVDGQLDAGAHALTIDAGGLPAGVYVIRAAGDRGVAVRRVVVM